MTRCAASTRSATWRRWSGSAPTSTTRRCTQAATTWGPRSCWPRWRARGSAASCWPRRWSSTAKASYSCAKHGSAATPPPRLAADLDAGRFEPRCDRCAEPLSAELVREDAPSGRGTSTRTRRSRRSIWPVPGPGRPGGSAVALRYHNVYGPGMPRDTPYAGVASFFRSALEAGRAPRVFEDGAQRRDFVHVRDVAGATVAGLEAVAARRRPGRARRAARLQRGQRHPAHRGRASVGAG